MSEIPQALPPGWDCKYDPRSSRYYFINHHTRITTWEDPRLRYRHAPNNSQNTQNATTEHIALQHGNLENRRNYVYPSQTHPQPAFTMPKNVPVQDLSNLPRGSPSSNKNAMSNRNDRLSQVVNQLKETTLTQSNNDTEQSVAKISTMFPTVSETHIRLLLKKYYNREAVVISALQVEKYPITTPGPYTTPPPARNPTGKTASPGPARIVGGVQNASPKPHSSPKMKLRYLKHVFPQVEETVLLEVLTNNDNHVQKASDALKEMGFEKKEMRTVSKTQKTKPEEPKSVQDSSQETLQPPRLTSHEEKIEMKQYLQEKYKDIPERVLTMALESVDYNKSRAIQILDIMVQEENAKTEEVAKKTEESKIQDVSSTDILKSVKISSSPSIQSFIGQKLETKVRRPKEKYISIRDVKVDLKTSDSNYKSSYLSKSSGPNAKLVKGSDNSMLLEEYVTWDGPDPNLHEGRNETLAKGPNKSLLSKRSYNATGPNSENRKGPAYGLAKGSIYSQITKSVTDSRGK